MTDEEQAAEITARAILAADPALGPIEVKYVDRNADIWDQRYLIVLFGAQGFLVDHIAGRTSTVMLDDRGQAGEARDAAIVESAKVIATRERLSRVYLVKSR